MWQRDKKVQPHIYVLRISLLGFFERLTWSQLSLMSLGRKIKCIMCAIFYQIKYLMTFLPKSCEIGILIFILHLGKTRAQRS